MNRNRKMAPQFALVLLAFLAVSADDTSGAEAAPADCKWDDKKSFSEFLSCVSSSRVKRNIRAEQYAYGHPCTSFVRLNQPERRVGNRINRLTDSALCDRTLKRRWYRFEGPGGGAMPTECAPEFHCGTHAPVWLNGAHPEFYGEVLDREACVSLNGNCCQRRWYIRVANCGDFYTYLLTDTPGCFMAYCAGSQTPCPPGKSSPTGFTPGCNENFPQLNDNVHMTFDKEGHKIAFYCDYDGTIPASSIIDVEWFAEGDNSGDGDAGEFPVYTDHMRERRRSVLEEGHWMGKMGSTIYCQMRARWNNRTGVPSPAIKSNKHFAGIKIMKRVVEVSEKEKEAHIQIQSTMPVVCLPQFADACKVTVELAHDPDIGGKRCVDGRVRQVVFGDCSVDITPDNWQEVHNVSVKAVRDFYRDGTKHMRVNFKPVYSTMSSPLWNNYELPEVEVIANDSPSSMCSSTGDPHYQTFDGLYYHVYLEGEFVLYKHTNLPIQINTRLEQCGKTVSCNCGVAVMAADDVIVIDRCMRRKRNLAFGKSFPEGWRTLHRHALEQGESFVEGLKIYEYDDGRRFTVHLPSGAYIDFRVGEHWVNIFLYASSDDWMATRGLCGTFDEDKSNDFTLRDGLTHTTAQDHAACGDSEDVCKFAESWRVRKEDSFFGQVVEAELTEHDFQSTQQYCKCEKTRGKTNVVCNYHYDVHNCQGEEEKENGVDKTDDVKIRPPEPPVLNWALFTPVHESTRRRRRSVELEEASNDYFESEFVFDETFKGTVPTWPTPSGVTETQARDYCIDVIMRSDTGRVCHQIVQERLSNVIDECMVDIKVTDDFTWAMSSLNTLTSECVNQIHQKAEYWESPEEDGERHHGEHGHRHHHGEAEEEETPTPSVGKTLLGNVCPGGCSRRGECREGKCHCHDGHGGDDCSTKLLVAPTIAYISDSGMCDVKVRPCRSIKVYGTGFQKTEDLKCHFRTQTGEIIQTDARFETFEEMRCGLPEHDVTPRNPDVQRGSPQEAFLLSIFQNGALSEDKVVLIYDSTCQMCITKDTIYKCVKKEHTCLVNGFCFEHGEKHPEDCCRLCDPSRSNDTLVGFKSNRAPILVPSQTSFVAYLGEPWQVDIQASDPDGCQVMYDVTPIAHSPFYLDVTSTGVSAELEAQETGTYAFNVTVEDECGGSVTQLYSVYLRPRRSSSSSSQLQSQTANAGVPRDCSVNRPPAFTNEQTNFTAVHNELVKLPMSALDPDGDLVEHYVIKNTDSYVSITLRGQLRYVAAPSPGSEEITVLAMDPCGARTFHEITITTRPCHCHHNGACVPRSDRPRGMGHYLCKCRWLYSGDRCQFRRGRGLNG